MKYNAMFEESILFITGFEMQKMYANKETFSEEVLFVGAVQWTKQR